MSTVLKVFAFVIALGVLTIVTQVGGLVLLLCLPVFVLINKRMKKGVKRLLVKAASAFLIYILLCFTLVPLLAKQLFNRAPMPVYSTATVPIKPRSFFYVLTNRHYVDVELKVLSIKKAQQLNAAYPGSKLCYLDCCFPFIDGFPLVPHLSHDDGKKIDFALLYQDKNGMLTWRTPSPVGYGHSELPLAGESDLAADCIRQGYYRYDLPRKLFPSINKSLSFDEARTAYAIQLFAESALVQKIFLEPNLEERLGLTGCGKIRFHGCQAARHDDHFHVQIN